MTLSEFKAWFEGYTEGLDGAPTEKQFKRIKAKVAEITGTPITQTVFVDRYRDYWRDAFRYPYVSYSAGSAAMGQGVGNAVVMNAAGAVGTLKQVDAAWDSHTAMYAIGKADAVAVSLS